MQHNMRLRRLETAQKIYIERFHMTSCPPCGCLKTLGSLNYQRRLRLRLRKSHLKKEFALPQTLSSLFQLVQFVKRWQFFSEFNSEGLYQSLGKEKGSFRPVSPSSTKT